MTDFSLIPACFIDEASLLHGASSVSATGGGLGGSVLLATHAPKTEGFTLTFEQGIGSFETLDEYLQLGYGNDRWQLSTRLAYATSPNNYKYRNRDKKAMTMIGEVLGETVEANPSGCYFRIKVKIGAE
jgi:iron complex outermembrane receptor protein